MYAFIADIHLGVNLKQSDFMDSLNMLFEIIHNHEEKCHCIFVCGDLFDHRMNIEEYKFATTFLMKLVCNGLSKDPRNPHVPVHFIKGTHSHDFDQYEIFLPFLYRLNQGVYYAKDNYVYINELGHKILYLPQLYGEIDYTELFNDKYDIIVGHGPMSSQTLAPCKCAHYEILQSVEQLGLISKICVFGHYHGFTDFGNNVFYAGPLLRWQFGQPEPRVFTICNDNFEMQTFPNPIAIVYKKQSIDNVETLRTEISKGIETPTRFIIDVSNTPKTEMESYYSIMNMSKKNKNISFQIVNTKEENDDLIDTSLIRNDDESSKINGIEDPIDSLINYISNKYNIDAEKEIHEYESKIKNE